MLWRLLRNKKVNKIQAFFSHENTTQARESDQDPASLNFFYYFRTSTLHGIVGVGYEQILNSNNIYKHGWYEGWGEGLTSTL